MSNRVFKSEDAKSGGWQQVREALTKFEANVTGYSIDFWGGTNLGDDGKPLPQKEYFEVQCNTLHVLETTEPLEMDVEGEDFSFRINMSESDNSFWIDNFVKSCEKVGILLPDGLTGKRVVFVKSTKVFLDKDGNVLTKFKAQINYSVESIVGVAVIPTAGVAVPQQAAAVATPPVVAAPAATPVAAPVAPPTPVIDPMEIARNLAVGKTEAQFRIAIQSDPNFANSPLLALAQAGVITKTLVESDKLKLGTDLIYTL